MYVCMNDRAPSLSRGLDPALNCALYFDMIGSLRNDDGDGYENFT